MTLFESVFAGNDAVYGLTEGAINQAIEKYGADKAVSFPDTAYSLPCLLYTSDAADERSSEDLGGRRINKKKKKINAMKCKTT